MKFRNLTLIAALGVVSAINVGAAWAQQEIPKPTFGGVVYPKFIDPAKVVPLDNEDPRFLVPENRKDNSDLILPDGYVEPEPPVYADSPEVMAALGITAAPLNRPVQIDSIGPNGLTPPDPVCAGGSSHVIVATNDDFAIYDRFGTLVSQFDINTYLNDTRFIFDPRVIWDTESNRFIMCWDMNVSDGAYSDAWENWLIVMVSRSSNPNDGFWTYYFPTEDDPAGAAGNKHWMDYPHIGVQRDAITATGRYFPYSGSGATGSWDRYFTFSKNTMVNGGGAFWWFYTDLFTDGTSTVNSVPLVHFTQRLSTVDNTQAMAYYMAAKTFATDKLWLLRLRIRDTDAFPTWEGYDPITVGNYVGAPGLEQNGVADLENVSPRLMNGVYYSNHFYTTHSIGAGTRAGHRTYKINNSGGFPIVWNDVWSNASFDYGYPAVAVDSSARAVVSYTLSSSTLSAGAYYGGRESADAAWSGSWSNRPGSGTYQVLFSGRNRWGDYSGASVDAWDENSFWVYGEAVNGTNNWITGLSRVSYKPFYSVVASNESVGTTETVALTATVTLSGSPASGKLVSFYVNGGFVGSSTANASGVAEVDYTPSLSAPTTRTIEARVSEDTVGLADTDESTLTITKHTPQIFMFSRTAQYGQSVNHHILLRRSSDFVGISGRTVTFKVAAVTMGSVVTDSGGDAFLDFTYLNVPNAYTLTGEFAGDAFYNAVSDTGTLTINLAQTNITIGNVTGIIGQNAPLSATLRRTHDSVNLVGQTINFTVGGVAVGSANTNGSGVATFNYLVPAGVLGNFVLSATYPGTVFNATSTNNATFTRTANTTLTVDDKSGERGQNITLTATLRRAHDNALVVGRTVNFTIDGTAVGSAVTNGAGVASLNYIIAAGLSVGNHTIGASFSAVDFLNNSTGSGTLAVSRWAVSLGVSNASGTAGQTINLLSQLTRSIDAAPVSGATMNYTIAGVGVGSAVTNASGIASRSYTIPVATLGNKVLGVSFAGNADYLPATNNGLFTQNGKIIGGLVILQDWTGPVAGRQIFVQVFNSGGTLVEQFNTTLDASSRWARTNSVASTGSHTVKIKASHWLARDTVVTFTISGNTAINHSLINGDSDGDNEVGGGDLSLVSAAFLTAVGDPGYNVEADLDGDGEVGSSDLSILSSNFLLTGD